MPNGVRGNLLADRLQAEKAGLKVILLERLQLTGYSSSSCGKFESRRIPRAVIVTTSSIRAAPTPGQ